MPSTQGYPGYIDPQQQGPQPIAPGNYQQLASDAQRRRMIADMLASNAMQTPMQQQIGPIAAPAGLAPGLGQIGQALLARRAGKRAESAETTAENARNQALAQALSGMGQPSANPYETAQGAATAGVDPTIVGEYLQRGRPTEPDLTDDMREYEAARQQGYQGTLQDWIVSQRKAGASQTNVNNMGSIPPGYRLVYDEAGNPVSMEPIPGSPAASEIAAAEDAANRRAEGEQSQADLVSQDIDRALETMSSGILPDTGFGAALSRVPGTDAKKLAGLFETIKANIGFDALNQMRQQSPTGGALGNVTERELALLQAVAGNLDQSQDKQTLTDNLNRLWNAYQDVIHGPGNGPERRQLSFQSERPAPPAVGAEVDGYRYKGGDPAEPSSWEKM